MNWIILKCPIYGIIQKELLNYIDLKPNPWRRHAIDCLSKQFINSSTYVIVGLSSSNGLICFAWINFADLFIQNCTHDNQNHLSDFGFAFLFHVYVIEKYRRMGCGSQLIKKTLEFALEMNSAQIVLCTDKALLQEKFYKKLGFNMLGSKTCLMQYDHRNQNKFIDQKNKDNLHYIRSLSIHDLATIQLFCLHKRWHLSNDKIKEMEICDIEKKFCLISTDLSQKQFYVCGTYKSKQFYAWIYYSRKKLYKEIIIQDTQAIDVLKISNNIMNLLNTMKNIDSKNICKVIDLRKVLSFVSQ